MSTFIRQLVDEINAKHGDSLDSIAIVFPTRRAGLYFQKELSASLEKPAWSPSIYVIQDFFHELSGLTAPDSLTLLMELHGVWSEYFPSEDFARFYSWGELLLRDFDEIDRYMVDASKVFATVNDLHQIEETFTLAEEDLERLRAFWKNFFDRDPTRLKTEFIHTWKKLEDVYRAFHKQLEEKGIAYEGMTYRKLAERAQRKELDTDRFAHIVFAGFYALSPSEQTVIQSLVESGKATAYWDADGYYVDDPAQESGKFFRVNPLTSDGFQWKENHFATQEKKIEMIGIPLNAGQAKYSGNILEQLMLAPGFSGERTAVVLPDEKLLLPVLYSLPEQLTDVNVTMGYPLRQTPLYNLFESLISLQRNARTSDGETTFYFRDILNILNHPYIRQIADKSVRTWLAKNDKTFIRMPGSRLIIDGESGFFAELFAPTIGVEAICNWLKNILRKMLVSMKEQQHRLHTLESEFIYQFYTQLRRLEDLVVQNALAADTEIFWNIFREILSSARIPFTGEPLKGLQVMGFLETRVLDFDNVVLLSANEDFLPASGSRHSFIPYNIRKAFGLPTYEDQHAVSAYHFFRLLQRAKNIYLIYNTESSGLSAGEKSRFLLQIEHELAQKYPEKVQLQKKILSTRIAKETVQPISVRKDDAVIKELSKYIRSTEKQPKALSASGLISYISCPLRFYFRYVAGLAEQEELAENMEAATFGKVLHRAMQELYSGKQVFDERMGSSLKKEIDRCVDKAIHEEFIALNQLEGKNILLRNIIRELVSRIVDSDKQQAPFRILQLEKDVGSPFALDSEREVRLFGIIDRVDEKDEVVRIIDYKTGKVIKKKPGALEDYFTDPAMKEQFQAMYYAYLTQKNMQSLKIKSGLLTMRSMSDGIWFLNNDEPYTAEQFREFESHLRKMIGEIFDPEIPFEQTTDEKRCTYCAYKDICNRN